MRYGLAIGLVLLHVLAGHRYAFVWQSDVTVWGRARAMAPQKVRPWMNDEKARAQP